jgi:hypothetical protein
MKKLYRNEILILDSASEDWQSLSNLLDRTDFENHAQTIKALRNLEDYELIETRKAISVKTGKEITEIRKKKFERVK